MQPGYYWFRTQTGWEIVLVSDDYARRFSGSAFPVDTPPGTFGARIKDKDEWEEAFSRVD